jgi:hypothetical protein
MGADGACCLLFFAAKQSGTFPPKIPAGLRARVSRLGGFDIAVSVPFTGKHNDVQACVQSPCAHHVST